MKTGVIVFPGSNCDEDIVYALKDVLKSEVITLWHKDHDLKGCDLIVLPGGFSYGDYLRSGAIARFSPIMKEVTAFAADGGYVFGICNGFQILCEADLLPGALLHNVHHQFICKNTYITPVSTESALTSALRPGQALKIPIAHGEGNFFADEETMKKMYDNGQVLFKYCDEFGNVQPESNPNGSLDGIAGICNEGKNVFGMMPHPERAVDALTGNTDGRMILRGLLNRIGVSA